VTLISLFVVRRGWIVVVMLAGVSIYVLADVGIYDAVVQQFKADRLTGARDLFTELDHFSAYRLGGYVAALEAIAERPITGYGFYGFQPVTMRGAVHNLWLRLLVEGGIALPVMFLLIVVRIFRHLPWMRRLDQGMGKETRDQNLGVILTCVVVGGVLIAMFTPNALLGSFQNSAIWWAVTGLLLRLSETRRARVRKRTGRKVLTQA